MLFYSKKVHLESPKPPEEIEIEEYKESPKPSPVEIEIEEYKESPKLLSTTASGKIDKYFDKNKLFITINASVHLCTCN